VVCELQCFLVFILNWSWIANVKGGFNNVEPVAYRVLAICLSELYDYYIPF